MRRTTSMKFCCCFVTRPFGVLTSTARKIAILHPTISGVIVTVFQPIKSELPGVRPYRMCLVSVVIYPQVFRNNRQSSRLPSTRCTCFCISRSVISRPYPTVPDPTPPHLTTPYLGSLYGCSSLHQSALVHIKDSCPLRNLTLRHRVLLFMKSSEEEKKMRVTTP